MNYSNVVALKPFVSAALAAGLAAAVAEMAFVLPIQNALGVAPIRLFQAIAYGLLGASAFRGGLAAAALGLAAHTVISIGAATVFLVVARFWDDVLLRKPFVSGLAFGAVVYLVMTFLVVPLSAIGFSPPKSLPRVWMSVAIHLLVFGPAVSIVSRAWLLQRVPRSGGV